MDPTGFKPAVPKVGSAASVILNPPAPPPPDGQKRIVSSRVQVKPPHIINRTQPMAEPVKKQYMWQLRRARGEKF